MHLIIVSEFYHTGEDQLGLVGRNLAIHLMFSMVNSESIGTLMEKLMNGKVILLEALPVEEEVVSPVN